MITITVLSLFLSKARQSLLYAITLLIYKDSFLFNVELFYFENE